MRRLFLLFSLIILGFAGRSQTSPVFVKDFSLQINGIMDIDQVPRDARTDFDSNPVCMIQVKAVGFDENLMQKFTFLGEGVSIMHKDIKNGMVILYVSSNKMGDIRIIHMGEYVYQLPYKLKGNKIYVMTLGMETATLVIRSVPTDADIYIDNEKVGTGYASKAVSIGAEHRYKVQCEYYWPKEGQVYFEKREEKEMTINLEPNFGFITIKTEPAGANVIVDDVKVGVTPYLTKKITLGTHVVELRKTGCETYSDVVDIKAKEVNKQLENIKLTAVQVPTGTLELTSNPTGAVVTINGRQYGQTPLRLSDFEIGTYIIDFSKEGYQNLQQTVTVKNGKKETLNVTLSKVSVPQQPVPTTTSFENRTFTVNGVSFEMVAVKGGTFTMGSTDQYADSDEKIIHNVTVSDFMIGKFEVTQKLWKAVMGSNPSYFKGDNLPVENVSWDDAQEFIRKLNQQTGQNFRLPTEAEWEYAARGGTNTSLYNGENINIRGENNSPNLDKLAWYGGNCGQNYTSYAGCDVSNGYDISRWSKKQYNDSKGGTHPVGLKQPNAYGLYDMLGNVWEWCQDWYGDYSSGSQTNPTGPSSGSSRVLRGGGWGSDAGRCRVSFRRHIAPVSGGDYLGFRLVLVP